MVPYFRVPLDMVLHVSLMKAKKGCMHVAIYSHLCFHIVNEFRLTTEKQIKKMSYDKWSSEVVDRFMCRNSLSVDMTMVSACHNHPDLQNTIIYCLEMQDIEMYWLPPTDQC